MEDHDLHLCAHTTGLDDLPNKRQRDMRWVARHVAEHGRFSVFEATATPALAKTFDRISKVGWFKYDYAKSTHPWIVCSLTERGRRDLGYE